MLENAKVAEPPVHRNHLDRSGSNCQPPIRQPGDPPRIDVYAVGPWLCVLVSRRVCPFEDEEQMGRTPRPAVGLLTLTNYWLRTSFIPTLRQLLAIPGSC
jgi:hypothetical protein